MCNWIQNNLYSFIEKAVGEDKLQFLFPANEQISSVVNLILWREILFTWARNVHKDYIPEQQLWARIKIVDFGDDCSTLRVREKQLSLNIKTTTVSFYPLNQLYIHLQG